MILTRRRAARSRERSWRRRIGALLLTAGLLLVIWVVVVWLWQDPFTAAYTDWQQHQLAGQYGRMARDWRPVPKQTISRHPAAARRAIADEAAAFRRSRRPGDPIGRIVIGRIGLNMILVDGTDHGSLEKGPGLDPRSYMPGEGRLVYIAGHRTTYRAPFADINDIRRGDYVRLEMPYATFVYRVTGHRIVPATDMAMLRSPRHELLRLQACHPRFFATQRYVVEARLVAVRATAASRASA